MNNNIILSLNYIYKYRPNLSEILGPNPASLEILFNFLKTTLFKLI